VSLNLDAKYYADYFFQSGDEELDVFEPNRIETLYEPGHLSQYALNDFDVDVVSSAEDPLSKFYCRKWREGAKARRFGIYSQVLKFVCDSDHA
jgi:hypothetical protein